ncbi:BatA and WFA domain-containing protein, partial [Bacteroidales bacterium AH-315-I05]|nr:BatA and WFA domain-containing protein [Bacteroidales bacterium AH-315-I05]
MYLRALMEFLYPSFLYALTAISIPIIIHLFNFRRFKKIYFTNVKFLREIKQETQSKSNLKHLLVLLARILAVAFLVLAFAQPYLPAENNKAGSGQKTVSVYIDNSFSMEAVNDEGRLLSQAKNAALEIANAYRPTDVFQLLTNDFEGRHQRLVNREEFIELVDEVEISPAVKLVSKIVGRQKDRLLTSETQDKTIFLISDFQKNTSDFSSLENDTTVTVKLLLMQAQQQSNLYVDSCWFATPFRQLNHPEKLTVRVKNISEKGYENIPIKLTINGRQKALASFSIEPQSWSDTSLYFTSTETGIQQVEIAITDYPVTFDDNFYLSYEVAEYISVLCINAEDTNKFIHSLFKNDDFIQL